ncbi:MAG: hypothetical protein JXB00_13450 [Bacteroidales bacterium]|nr:hypothetical protein [Bacteroidales bacterium]
MKTVSSLVVLLLFLWNGLSAFGGEKDSISISQYENKIAVLFEYLYKSASDDEKVLINKDILENLEKVLSLQASFQYPFDSLKRMGILLSPDKKLRAYTWNIAHNNRTTCYFGFLQYSPVKNQGPLVYRLADKSDKIENPEFQVLSADNWYGALYYDIIEAKDQHNKYYTLLGFDFNNFLSSKKIIDILYFTEKNEPVFGKPLFRIDNKLVNRVIFEYSSQASMNLRYHKDADMIVFDHLSPSKPSYTGKFEFYGPDMSYDALKFEKGFWTLKKDIDIRN